MGRSIRRVRSGGVQLRLGEEERTVLRSLPSQLRELLEEAPEDPSLERLFPPAYLAHPDHDAEYRRLMNDDLRERRLEALAVMEKTADADRLSDDEAGAWLAALNSLRLVLGTRLDVSEDMVGAGIDPDDPRSPGLALYSYL
ncbi:MAG: DUF2017 family protein [Acidimicrobiales bacterium]